MLYLGWGLVLFVLAYLSYPAFLAYPAYPAYLAYPAYPAYLAYPALSSLSSPLLISENKKFLLMQSLSLKNDCIYLWSIPYFKLFSRTIIKTKKSWHTT
jgi:hypothetical protein